MKKLFLILFSLPILCFAANEEKVLIIHKTNVPILVDGIIDDAWAQADSATNFFQLSPFYGKPVTRHTLAKVLTTENSIYCIIICYDQKDNIHSNGKASH